MQGKSNIPTPAFITYIQYTQPPLSPSFQSSHQSCPSSEHAFPSARPLAIYDIPSQLMAPSPSHHVCHCPTRIPITNDDPRWVVMASTAAIFPLAPLIPPHSASAERECSIAQAADGGRRAESGRRAAGGGRGNIHGRRKRGTRPRSRKISEGRPPEIMIFKYGRRAADGGISMGVESGGRVPAVEKSARDVPQKL